MQFLVYGSAATYPIGVQHETAIAIKGGTIVDPRAGRVQQADLLVKGGLIAEVSSRGIDAQDVLDATGLLVVPGLIDLHVHLREPGGESKETIESGTAAAVAGGFTAVACMPNTKPPLDNPEIISRIRARADKVAQCRVHPIGCITQGRQGRTLADLAGMAEAGALAFSDDGDGVADDALMAEAFRCCARLGKTIIQHCEARSFGRGAMHAGRVSEELGVSGLSPLAEELMIARDLALVESCGGSYHVAHISTAFAVELVRRAKRNKIRVTTEVCPHHLLLCDEDCRSLDPNTKMHPPLRTREDVEACIAGVKDGTIDFLVTDHAPHTAEEKAQGFLEAPPGIVGLETSLALFAKALVEPGHLDFPALINLMSTVPAQLFGLPGGTLTAGAPADITLIDPDAEWVIDPERFLSKGRNSPFAGMTVKGRTVCTLVDGAVKHNDRAA